MSTQSEAALEAGLIATLRQMDYEYVQIVEEDNLYVNFKRQLEIHNKKQLAEVGRTSFTDEEFEKILIYLEGGTRFEKAKKLRDLYPLDMDNGFGWNFSIVPNGVRMSFRSRIRLLLKDGKNAAMM